MTLDLAGIFEKLRRATEHLDALTAWFLPWVEQHRDSARFDGEYGRTKDIYVFRLAGMPDVPLRVGVEIGDIIHNFRSAMDHLAWQVVLNGTVPAPEKPRDVQWPIYDTAGQFGKNVDRRLPGMTDAQRAIVQGCQPYDGGYRGRLFARLADLSNKDKHQVLNPVFMYPIDFRPEVLSVRGGRVVQPTILLGPTEPLINGTPVLSVTVDPPGTEVQVGSGTAFYEAFDDGANVWKAIGDIGIEVGTVVAEMAQTFL